jgi:hypothetical protein
LSNNGLVAIAIAATTHSQYTRGDHLGEGRPPCPFSAGCGLVHSNKQHPYSITVSGRWQRNSLFFLQKPRCDFSHWANLYGENSVTDAGYVA